MVAIHGYHRFVLRISDIIRLVHAILSLSFPLVPLFPPYPIHLDTRMSHPLAVKWNKCESTVNFGIRNTFERTQAISAYIPL